MSIDVQGTVAPGFESVRTEFAAVVAADNGESGAQPAAFVHGTPVVDLWAGPQVTGDTLTGLLSATKGAATVVVPLPVQEGRLKLDQPVAAYWPEFAERGQGGDHPAAVHHHSDGRPGSRPRRSHPLLGRFRGERSDLSFSRRAGVRSHRRGRLGRLRRPAHRPELRLHP
ncbi:serine hydrolase domain-containing protein [Nocardia brasiliensis]|uniref:serine hydrolase domain-containing protein n=1 Tax=Nocardia brasiliensis TaxID=37326 RepID=UPI000AAA26EF|nr:serine hydrolase domain-containing protein [Nocardia brasiliensis]